MALMRILCARPDLPATLTLAEHPAVDAVRLEVWVRAGSALMSRARTLGPLPVTLGRRRMHRERRDEMDVRALLAGLEDRARRGLARWQSGARTQ